MEFSPFNNIVKLCIQGMAQEETGKPEEAGKLFRQAWDEATNDFEKFIAAHHLARIQRATTDRLEWLHAGLDHALKLNDDQVKSAIHSLYSSIANCYSELHDHENAELNFELAQAFTGDPTDKGPFYHGTRADLKTGDLLTPGFNSNYQSEITMNHIYFTANPNGAGLAAALAKGDGPERVYLVEPSTSFENDPNVTNKKFPGNPTRSYRTSEPLKIIGELTEWARQSPEEIQKFREKLAGNKGEIIN